MQTMNQLRNAIATAATAEGFELCGVAPAVESNGYSDLLGWIDAGYAAGMSYFADRLEAYQHPCGVMQSVKTIVVLAYPYPRDDVSRQANDDACGYGNVARYAWPETDYHDVIHPKLKRLGRIIDQHVDDEEVAGATWRGVVDTAPLLEREVAQLAGLGWRAKNTLLIRPGLGSYFFLACLLVDLDLPVDRPFDRFHCGTCTACLDACPTDAFPQPGVLDASKCISYLTIEHRGMIPAELRPAIGDWLFGCDVCQEVCPWNRKPGRDATERSTRSQQWHPLRRVDLRELFDLDEDEFRHRFRKTPFWRSRRRGILRNAAIVLGNQANSGSKPTLQRGLKDPEPIVRATCAWALTRLPIEWKSILRSQLECETDAEARQEMTRLIGQK